MFQIKTIEQYAFRGFASALESIPLALAENSGLDPIRTLTEIKAKQVAENNNSLGVNCFNPGEYGKYYKSGYSKRLDFGGRRNRDILLSLFQT